MAFHLNGKVVSEGCNLEQGVGKQNQAFNTEYGPANVHVFLEKIKIVSLW